MKITINILLTIAIFCCDRMAFAQEKQAILLDFKNIHQRYTSLTNYSMNYEIRYIGDQSNVVSTQTGKVIHTDNLHYVNQAGITTLIKGQEFISVSKSNKFIVYNKREKVKNEQDQTALNISSMLDSLFQYKNDFVYSYLPVKKGNKKIFIRDTKSKIYDAYSIRFDANTYQLLEVVYFIKPEKKQNFYEIQITYLAESSKPKTNLPALKKSYYVQSIAGNLKPSTNFKGFELMDQTK